MKNITMAFCVATCIFLIGIIEVYAEPEVLKIKELYIGMPISEAKELMAEQFGKVKVSKDNKTISLNCDGIFVCALNSHPTAEKKLSKPKQEDASSSVENEKEPPEQVEKVYMLAILDAKSILKIGDMSGEELMRALCDHYEIPLDQVVVHTTTDRRGYETKNYSFKTLKYGYIMEVNYRNEVWIMKQDIPKTNFN